jgi:thiazole tautomerase (transcriptional regulator TenI)
MPAAELHIISNGKQSLDAFARIAGAIHPHVDAFHLREKSKSARELWQGIELLGRFGVPLDKIIVNDRVDVAWAAGARAVQLAYHSLDVALVKQAFPGLRIGCSVHSLEEAKRAEVQGADFLIYGHIFSTESKPGIEPRGITALERLAGGVAIPVIAIGGIKPNQATQVLDAGAAGVAVMSGVVEAVDPLAAAREYEQGLYKWKRGESQ